MPKPEILSCDIAALKHYNKESNGRVSRDQINTKICSSHMKNDETSFYAQECGVKPADSIPVSSDEQLECEFDPNEVIKTFETQPCNPIRWSPKALVQKLCSLVGNNTYSSQTERDDIKATMEIIKQKNTENLGNTPHFSSTNPTLDLAANNNISVEINTPRISFNPTTESLTTTTLAGTTLGLGVGIISIIAGGSAIIIGAIGGIVWYTCSKSSKNTSTDKKHDIEMSDMSNKQNKVDQETTCLLDNPPITTEIINEVTNIREITNINNITNVYEVINTKDEASNLLETSSENHPTNSNVHNAAQEVANSLNGLAGEIEQNLVDEIEQKKLLTDLMNIATSSNDHIVQDNESNDVQSRNADQEMGDDSLNNLLGELTNMVTSHNDHIVQNNEQTLLGDDS